MAAVARHEKSTLPPVVALLALGTLLMCTTEFMIAGLLAQMADDFGVTMAIPPVATGLSVRLAGSAPTLAAALTVSPFNGGIAAGSLVGGQTLDTALGETGPATVGVVMVTLGLVALIALAAKRVSR